MLLEPVVPGERYRDAPPVVVHRTYDELYGHASRAHPAAGPGARTGGAWRLGR
ncbi:hypothetical protein ACIBG4_01155 [Nonomuraea sp. NPDC050383]|uniref:hypothetical protein n=1 Tax=Nonomuraea sp. NPDC050383 TaxID=3364362 RepID=UPI0037935DEE